MFPAAFDFLLEILPSSCAGFVAGYLGFGFTSGLAVFFENARNTVLSAFLPSSSSSTILHVFGTSSATGVFTYKLSKD